MTDNEQMVAELREHEFLSALSPGLLEQLAGCAEHVSFEAQTEMVREGKFADGFFAIRSGRVAVGIRTPARGLVVLDTLIAGEVLGWSWLLPPYKWSFDAVALEPVEAIQVHAMCIRPKLDQDPRAGYELALAVASVMAERMDSARLRLVDLYGEVDDY